MTLNGRRFARETDILINVRFEGANLMGAEVRCHIKEKLSQADDAPNTIRKGNIAPLSGITITTNTDTVIEGVIAIAPSEWAILPNREELTLQYAINVKSQAGLVDPIEAGSITIYTTAILSF